MELVLQLLLCAIYIAFALIMMAALILHGITTALVLSLKWAVISIFQVIKRKREEKRKARQHADDATASAHAP